jgi:hypothetical protein
MNASIEEVERALLDVRRAYRLLHDYQRAALDAAKYVGSQLGFAYRDGYARFSAPAPKNGKNALGCWAWDWLNFVHFDLNFFRNIEGEKELGLSIMLFGDTGIYLGNARQDEEPDNSTFPAAEHSKTKVGFLLFRDWEDEWDGLFFGRDGMRRFLEQDGSMPEAISSTCVVGKCFDFSQLANEDSTERLITDLIQFAKTKGFTLERIKES